MLHRPQRFQNTLPREHRNTPWAEHTHDEHLLVAIVSVLASITIALLVL